MNRVAISPELLRWARERSGRSAEALTERFPKLPQWERGEVQPTLKQLEGLARATFVPVGYFFLASPPAERVPIPDLRTRSNWRIDHPSPDLLDALYLCQRRQTWYRDWARSEGEEARAFVGSVRLGAPVERTAGEMRRALAFDLDARRVCPTWTEALGRFIALAEEIGVLVMVSGVVGSNTHRKLDPEEFRGFALSDDLAPLVFINGADTKAAQMFTLAHELAHLWLGESALTDDSPGIVPRNRIESWCNQVAAELLVPLAVLRDVLPSGDVLAEVQPLARHFKVSALVILRRLLDTRRLSRQRFEEAYKAELALIGARSKPSGGDFYLTQPFRLSRRFARALVTSTLEGQTLFRDAFRMLGINKVETFHQLGERLAVSA